MKFRILIGVIVTCILLWSGYWFYGKHIHQSKIENLSFRLQSADKFLDYDNIHTTGFPNRFDTTIKQPTFIDPHFPLSWKAEFLQILSLSYQPYRLIVVWPQQQTIHIGNERIEVNAEGLRASLSLRQSDKMDFDNVIVESDSIQLSGSNGWNHRFSKLLLAMRHKEPLEHQNAIEIAARAVHLPAASGNLAPPSINNWPQLLLNNLTNLNLAISLGFSGSFTGQECAAGSIELQQIDIAESVLKWKRGQLMVNGQLNIADGKPSGTLTLDAGKRGFANLFGNFDTPTHFLPFSAQAIQSAAFFLDTFTDGQIRVQIKEGKLIYKGIAISDIPELRICQST